MKWRRKAALRWWSGNLFSIGTRKFTKRELIPFISQFPPLYVINLWVLSLHNSVLNAKVTAELQWCDFNKPITPAHIIFNDTEFMSNCRPIEWISRTHFLRKRREMHAISSRHFFWLKLIGSEKATDSPIEAATLSTDRNTTVGKSNFLSTTRRNF